MKKSTLYWVFGSIIFVLVLSNILLFFYRPAANHYAMDMEEKTVHFISLKDTIQLEQLDDRKYKCCLVKPCTYCIEKSPGHGEGAECNCIKDLVEGVHPCGECIGEILEGHGNPNLAKYFANAIAEKVGKEHIQTLKEIMKEKYGVPIDEQYDF